MNADNPKTVVFSIRLDADLVEAIKKEAERLDIPPATFAKNVLTVGWDEYRAVRRWGFVWLYQAVRKTVGRWQHPGK